MLFRGEMMRISTAFASTAFLAVALVAGGPSIASAQNLTDFGLGGTLGTLGLGVEGEWQPSRFFGVRAGYSFFDYSFDNEFDDIDYDGDLELSNGGAMLDVYPFGGIFRLSGGVRFNGNEVSLTGRPTGTVEIGDVTYTAEQVGTLAGQMDFNSVAPVATLGIGSTFFRSLRFSFDAGVMFQGAPDVALTADGTLASDPIFQAELERERQKIEDDADLLRFYPVAQLSLTWRF